MFKNRICLKKVAAFGLLAMFVLTHVAFADVSVAEAYKIARTGAWPDEPTQSVTLDRHGFYIRPFEVQETADGLSASGFFRHRHRGKDDRIYFELVVRKGQPVQASITRIHFRGPLAIGDKVFKTAANVYSDGKFDAALKEVNLSTIVDGNWIPQARKIVGEMGRLLNAEVNH